MWVAATAMGASPDWVLQHADMAGVAAVVADAEQAHTAPLRAAALLFAVLRHRPLPRDNFSIAWLCAVMALAEDGHRVRLSSVASQSLIAQAERGELTEVQVAAVLTGGRLPSPPRLVGRCPQCGSELHVFDHERLGTQPVLVGSSAYELIARCWYEHRTHDKRGRPLRSVAEFRSDCVEAHVEPLLAVR